MKSSAAAVSLLFHLFRSRRRPLSQDRREEGYRGGGVHLQVRRRNEPKFKASPLYSGAMTMEKSGICQ